MTTTENTTATTESDTATTFTVAVSRDDLVAALTYVSKTLPSRPPLPVLGGVLLTADAEHDALTLATFDYEISTSETIRAIQPEATRSGRVLVGGKLLKQITSKLDKGSTVQLAIDGARVTIGDGDVTYRLLAMPAEDYPNLPDLASAPVVATLPGTLLPDMARVTAATSKDDALPILGAVSLDADDGTLTASATDRYRVATYDTSVPAATGGYGSLAIPADAFKRAATELGKAGEITIHTREHDTCAGDGIPPTIGFVTDRRRLTVRTLDGDTPNYRKPFPTNFAATLDVDTKTLLKAVDQAAVVTERGTPISLHVTDAAVRVEAGCGDEAHAEKTVDAASDGGPMRVAFNPAYLTDALHAIGAGTVHMAFTQPDKPAVFWDKENPALRWLQMPVRLPG